MIDLNSIVSRAVEAQFKQLDDELLAIDEQAGFLYSMNETASRVWELIAQPSAVSNVCSHLRRTFAVDKATCQREVLVLLQELHEAGLVQVND